MNVGTVFTYEYLFFYIFLFILGTCLGSFYLLIGQRIPRGEDIVKKRSHCENCDHTLVFWELIPVFSYILLKGKCRNCNKKIGIVYIGFECLSGILFTSSAFLLRTSNETLVAWTLLSLLLIITVTDITAQKIPNKVLIPFFILAIIERFTVQQLNPWWFAPLGFAVGFGVLFLLALLSKGGMAGGDIKLFAVLGLFLGPIYILITLVLASVLALVYSIGEMIIKKKLRKHIPFGPFIALGSWLVYCYATGQLNYAFSLFFG
ncbi:leader peptidase (prepilin peptidase)/N-methyltransferase [Enterococcus sp. DIV0212c]|uniref:prepilin peptidase n=1 Tax=Enterococcus sp. DIV0212c TaxID=2230867 RepID=UPI001A9BC5F9|nr:A24 family peptidase [Enterococcus sp. DIV0212c]MBO1353827.1 prepilin peptidase [Enterococcus sp. DIV0212c]